MRKFDGGRLLLATHNAGKVREITDLLAPYVQTFLDARTVGIPEPEETGTTFEDNAILKAQAAAQATGDVALADDSGLAVRALDGAPGIYSARWSGPDKDFVQAMRRVYDELGGAPDRSASFICVLALGWPDGHSEVFRGSVEGTVVWPMRGEKGFGYDPIFQPKGYDITFAQMEPARKHAMSHRARAFEQMLAGCFQS